jgi:hypothetical protein
MMALSACSTTMNDVATPDLAPAGATVGPITADELVGKWGLGSFRNEADLARTTDEARRFCNNPYIITKGPTGGVMMYLADQSSPTEVFVKTASGRVYIGPQGPAGVQKDRQITSFQNGVMVAAWVDPTVTARYGTMVFVRCPDGATKPVAATPRPAAAPAATPAAG